MRFLGSRLGSLSRSFGPGRRWHLRPAVSGCRNTSPPKRTSGPFCCRPVPGVHRTRNVSAEVAKAADPFCQVPYPAVTGFAALCKLNPDTSELLIDPGYRSPGAGSILEGGSLSPQTGDLRIESPGPPNQHTSGGPSLIGITGSALPCGTGAGSPILSGIARVRAVTTAPVGPSGASLFASPLAVTSPRVHRVGSHVGTFKAGPVRATRDASLDLQAPTRGRCGERSGPFGATEPPPCFRLGRVAPVGPAPEESRCRRQGIRTGR